VKQTYAPATACPLAHGIRPPGSEKDVDVFGTNRGGLKRQEGEGGACKTISSDLRLVDSFHHGEKDDHVPEQERDFRFSKFLLSSVALSIYSKILS
jgi:hypothetical protein